MRHNVGTVDKIIRWIIGIVIAVLGIYFKSWWGLVAIIPILSAIFSFCPVYAPFNLSTRKKKE